MNQSYCRLVVFCVFVLVSFDSASAQETNAAPADPGWERNRLLRPDVDLAAKAARLERADDFGAAAKVYREMVAAASTENAKVFALQRQAECLYQAGKLEPAYSAYRKLGEGYPRAVDYSYINQRLRQIAEAYASGTGRFLGAVDLETAREIYKLVLTFAPAGPQAPADTMRLAELQTTDDLTAKARLTYREVLQKFPQSDEAPYARLALAELYLRRAHETQERWEPARQARQAVDIFTQRHSEHPALPRAKALGQAADEELAQHLLYLGQFYYRPAHYRPQVTRRYLSDLIREYGHTTAAAEARMLLAQLEGRDVEIVDGAQPPEEALTPEQLLSQRRRLPPPPELQSIPPKDDGGVTLPAGPLLIEESERVKKWLRPIPDLGIGAKE